MKKHYVHQFQIKTCAHQTLVMNHLSTTFARYAGCAIQAKNFPSRLATSADSLLLITMDAAALHEVKSGR